MDADGEVPRKLAPEDAQKDSQEKRHVDEKIFRWEVNDDAMATEKLAEGIRNFAKDTVKLEKLIQQQL